MTNKSYVYIHVRKNGARTGSIFYVGKGCNNRLNETRKRNKYWQNTVNKYGFESFIICDGLTDDEAFSLEKEIIGAIGEYLCNIDPGGNGFKSGYLHPHYKIKNHPLKGKKLSEPHKAKIGENSKMRISINGNPMQDKLHNDLKRMEISEKTKMAMSRPEVRERFLKAIREASKRKSDARVKNSRTGS